MVNVQVPQWKIEEVAKLVDFFRNYKTVAVINVAKINDQQIQEMRKLLRDKAVIKMSKKRLQIRAIEKYKKESGKPNLEKLAENIPGQSSLVFTNMDVFELKRIFEENKWMIPAKPNSITPVDIWVPAGDTGLPTGQVISELNMTLKLPTRIQNDTIWIREDTRTHKAGDFVTVKQASVLKKLGVKPLESTIKIHYVWSDGEIIPADVIYMDMEKFNEEFISAVQISKRIAVELRIIDDETIEPLVQKAYREALSILFEMPILAEDMIDKYIEKAVSNASFINAVIFREGIIKEDQKSGEIDKKAEPEPEEEEEESVGIGGLFG